MQKRRPNLSPTARWIASTGNSGHQPVSTAASLEFGFSQPSYIICETVHADVPWRPDVVQEGFTVEPKGRIVKPNTKPGLGIVINEAEVKKHGVTPRMPDKRG